MSYLRDLPQRMLLDSTSHKYKKISQRRPLMQETCRPAAASMSHQTTPLSIVGPRITIRMGIITLARSLTKLELDLVTKFTTTLSLVTGMKNTMDPHREAPRSVTNNMNWVMRLIIAQLTTPALQPTAGLWKRRTRTFNREAKWIKCLAVEKKTISKERARQAPHASLNIQRESPHRHNSRRLWALKASMIRSLPPIVACSRIVQNSIPCMRHSGQRSTKLTSEEATWRRVSAICALTTNINSNNKCENNRCSKPSSSLWRIRTQACPRRRPRSGTISPKLSVCSTKRTRRYRGPPSILSALKNNVDM